MKNRLILILIFFKLSPVNLYAFSLFDDFKIQYLRGNSEYYSKSHSSIDDKTISDYQSFRLIYKNIGVAKSFNQLENTTIKSGYKAHASMEIYDIIFHYPFDKFSLTFSKNIKVEGEGSNNYGSMEFKKAEEKRIISSYLISYKIKIFLISIGYVSNDFIFTRKCEYENCYDEYFHNETYLLLYGLSF